jgi:hypothetical protein
MTAENFQVCLAFALKYEGGRSNDPRDPGGRTMEGVMQATYDAYRVKKGVGRADVYTISAAERDEIYRKEYWDLIKGDGLRSGEDLCVFDFAVNSGVARARDLSAVWRTSPVNDAIECARTGFRSCMRCALGAILGQAGDGAWPLVKHSQSGWPTGKSLRRFLRARPARRISIPERRPLRRRSGARSWEAPRSRTLFMAA